MSVQAPPALAHFLAAYFHQDWAEEHESARAVIAGFASGESPETVEAVRDEARALAASDASEVELDQALEATGFEYLPSGDGLTNREFLALVASTLD